MILPRFDLLVPESLSEACTMLNAHAKQGAGARILAGGTDLLVDLRQPIIPRDIPRCDGCDKHPNGNVASTVECAPTAVEPSKPTPACLISLHKLEELKGIEKLDDGSLKIGALTTIRNLERSAEIRAGWTALAEGADDLGSPLVRNRGTIGGNIANARPAADTVIPVIVLGASLTLKSNPSSRIVTAAEFPTGPGRSIIKPNEIITEINLPACRPHSGSAYYKLANRKALEISTVGVAVWLALEKPGGPVADVRVALGAVGPTPILAKSVEDILVGEMPDDDTLNEAARAAASDARPIDDHRGSAWYRLQAVESLTRRLLDIVIKRAEQAS